MVFESGVSQVIPPPTPGVHASPSEEGQAHAAQGPLVLVVSDTLEGQLRAVQKLGPVGPLLLVRDHEEAARVLGSETFRPRRPASPAPPERSVPGLSLDEDRQSARTTSGETALTPLEFAFLACLARVPGQVHRFRDLVSEVWGTDYLGDLTQVHSVVKRLRRKLERIGAPVVLQAVRGVGFRLVHLKPARPLPS